MTDILFEKAKELALVAYDEMKLSFESHEPKKCEELEKEMYKILRASDLSITDQVHSVKQLLLNVLAMISAEHLKAELKMQTERAQSELR
jgi:hypothetical protein|tara:strand:- start:25 stop:294 length:270 start_codon:yes stop_codon:yes gene_type:complete